MNNTESQALDQAEQGTPLHEVPVAFRRIYDAYLAAVRQDGCRALWKIPKVWRTAEICLAAVRVDGMALIDVPKKLRTAEVCLEAVRQDGLALEYVPKKLRTAEVCLEAVSEFGLAIELVPEELRTEEICLEAARRDGRALAYVPEALLTPEICLVAVRRSPIALRHVPEALLTPEMKLLRTSIVQDGYTQPIVTFPEGEGYTVVDGFHRNRCGKEYKDVQKRVKGYLPITIINADREDRSDRIAATIRHNRARGKHQVKAMSDIVIELSRRNWNDEKIGMELGMEPDEVLRLKQITGLAELFAAGDFSEAWE